METTKNQSSKQTHKCSLCDYETTRKYNLTRHMKNAHHESSPPTNIQPVEEPSASSSQVQLQPSEQGKQWFLPYLSCVGRYNHNDIIVAVYEDLQKRQHTFTEDVDPDNTVLEQLMTSLSSILKDKTDANQENDIQQFYLAYDIFLILGALLMCRPCLIRKSKDAYKECIILAAMALRVLGYSIVPSHNEHDGNDKNKDSDTKHCNHVGCSGCHHD